MHTSDAFARSNFENVRTYHAFVRFYMKSGKQSAAGVKNRVWVCGCVYKVETSRTELLF